MDRWTGGRLVHPIDRERWMRGLAPGADEHPDATVLESRDEPDDRDDAMTRQVTITMTECEASWLAGLVERTRFGSLSRNIWEAQMLHRALWASEPQHGKQRRTAGAKRRSAASATETTAVSITPVWCKDSRTRRRRERAGRAGGRVVRRAGGVPRCGEDAERLLRSGPMGEDMPHPDEVAVCAECWPKGWYKLDENEQVRRVPLEKGPWRT
jgi:hypothetical protein